MLIEPPTVTHHAKRIGRAGRHGRPVMFDSPALKAARRLYYTALMASGQRPPRPLDGPISLDVVLCFPAGRMFDWHTVKPDRDNSEKALMDELVHAGFIRLDQRVCSGHVAKIKGPVPFIWIRGYELTEDNLASQFDLGLVVFRAIEAAQRRQHV